MNQNKKVNRFQFHTRAPLPWLREASKGPVDLLMGGEVWKKIKIEISIANEYIKIIWTGRSIG